MKNIRALLFSLLTLFVLVAAPAAADQGAEVRKIWQEIRRRWDRDINTYSTSIFSWAYRTQYYIDHLPPGELPKNKDEKLEEDWVYRIYGVKARKPNLVLLSYDFSGHEHLERGSLIDRAVAYTLKYIPGTLLNYGFKDEENVYARFPLVSTKEVFKMDIPIVWRAAMTAVVIASRNEVYWKPLDEMKDPRGSRLTDVIIGETMNRFEHYFNIHDGSIEATLSKAPRISKEDYVLGGDGWLTLKKGAMDGNPQDLLILTFIDNDEKRCRGINRRVAFIDPEIPMFVGLQEYELDKLVSVYHFYDLKLNDDLPESLWSDYFKGRSVSDRK
ncbi:MAG: hypothetical protein AB1742_03155 [bacterium]